MFSSLQAVILGAVQGLTEFLPVSSSAHLVVVPWLMTWEDPGLAFDVALHLGTLLALLLYYWREWLSMGFSVFEPSARAPRRLLGLLLIASIPGAIIGLLFEKQAESIFRSPILIASTMAVLGIILSVADTKSDQKVNIDKLTVGGALLIGMSQALAIVPGVSRSGSTITMGRILGMERQDAANFSFLMATPIIAGAGLIEAGKLFRAGMSAQLGLGFLTSAVFGLLAIAGLIRFVRTRTYQPFVWYRILFAIVVVAVVFVRA